jgi:hypothetical protein
VWLPNSSKVGETPEVLQVCSLLRLLHLHDANLAACRANESVDDHCYAGAYRARRGSATQGDAARGDHAGNHPPEYDSRRSEPYCERNFHSLVQPNIPSDTRSQFCASPLEDFKRAVSEANLEDRVHYLGHGDTYEFEVSGVSSGD